MKKNDFGRWAVLVLIGACALALSGCGGGGGAGTTAAPPGDGGNPPPPAGTVAVQGNVVGATAPAGVRTAARAAALAPLAGTTAVVMVDESGHQAASQLVTAADGRFSFTVPTGLDYVMVFREGNTNGRTLGILTPDASGLTTISLPAGVAALDLGDIELDLKKGKAKCITQKTVAHAAAEFGDTDGDGIPDLCDLSEDEDGDGVPDLVDSFHFDTGRFAAFALVELPSLVEGGFTLTEKINATGEVAGSSTDAAGVMQAVKWTVDGAKPVELQVLSPLAAGKFSAAHGLNDRGEVVGQAEDGAGLRTAVLWRGIDPIQLSPGITGSANGVNDSGVAVGMTKGADGERRAAAWAVDAAGGVGGPEDLGLLAGGTFSVAHFITKAGLVVGEADDAAGFTRAVAWTVGAAGTLENGPIDLGVLAGGDFSAAYGANDSGMVVGESQEASQLRRAVYWQVDVDGFLVAGPALIGAPALNSGKNVAAFAINDSGWIAGTSEKVTAQGLPASVVWDPAFKGGTLYEAVNEVKASEARGINRSGQIAGSFKTADGTPRGFVASQAFQP